MHPESGLALGAAFLLGFVGSAHCLAMCGGIAGALGLSARGADAEGFRPWLLAGLHSSARVASYTMIGAVFGAAGSLVEGNLGWGPALRIFAGAVIVGQGLRVLGFDLGFSWLERRGLSLWRQVSPHMRRLGAPGSATRATAIGLAWGLLPCGLVYTAAATSAATGSAGAGALWMAAFGLGTMPAMAATSMAAGGLTARMRSAGAQRAAGAMLVVFGLIALGSGVAALGHGPVSHASSPSASSHLHTSLDSEIFPTCNGRSATR